MTAGETGWAAVTELAGPLGLVLLVAAVVVAAVLEVLDEGADARTAHAAPRRHRHAARRSHRAAWLVLRVSLVVLVLAALAATAARVVPVLGA